MAFNTSILNITLTGAGTEIPTLNVTDPYTSYLITGSATAIGNYTIVPTGTPQLGTTFLFTFNGILDITTNSKTFSLFGVNITQAQLAKSWEASCYYNGSSWDVDLKMDFAQTGIISTDNLTDLSVTTSKFANLAVTSTKIAADAVTTVKVLDSNITTPKIADDAITTIKILDNNVTTNKINPNAVTNARLAQMAAYTIKGNNTGALADPQDISASTLINANAWSLTGNSGTVAGTNFIGTTDAIDLVFKRNNSIIGYLSGSSVLFGQNCYSGSLQSGNVGIGDTVLFSITSGQNNTAIGAQCLYNINSGSNNTGIGQLCGQSITTGLNNTIIGSNADVDSSGANNRIALGYGASADADYQFALPDNVTLWKIRGNSFTLPSADGSANQVLKTNGSGVLSFGSALDSGTYTPTLTNGTNVAGSTAFQCQYLRVGNQVTVSGKVNINPTSTGATELGFSLPVASNFANEYECGGTGNFSTVAGEGVAVMADSTNNRASFQYVAVDTADKAVYFTFTYTII